MRRWFVLGAGVVAVAWGPYLYTEVARRVARESPAELRLHRPPADGSESQLSAASDKTREEPVDLQPSAAEVAPRPHVPEEPFDDEPQPTTANARPEPGSPAARLSHADEPPSSAERELPAHAEPTRTDLLGRAFDEEPRDAFWANDQEAGLRGALQALELSPDAVTDTACRRTVCRVTFSAPQLEPEVAKRVLDKITPGFGAAALDNQEPESDRHAVLYLLRPGYEAPTSQPAR
ncbi:MAG: hypothetical protein ABW321_16865 [Polyangiales bacterium]